MRYIEIDSIIEQIKAEHCERCTHNRCTLCDIDEMLCLLEEADDADVVEVVRCKDCEYWECICNGTTGRCESPRNGLVYEYTDDFDSCSYGERKEK